MSRTAILFHRRGKALNGLLGVERPPSPWTSVHEQINDAYLTVNVLIRLQFVSCMLALMMLLERYCPNLMQIDVDGAWT